MRAWAEIRYAVNSTLCRSWFRPLDRLLAAKIAIRGYPGMEFHLKNNDTGHEFDVTLTEKDETASKDGIIFNQKIIPVELGGWTVTVKPFNGGGEATIHINVDEQGKIYYFSYSTLTLIEKITENRTYTFQESIVHITASGGGGGGGGGGAGGMTYNVTNSSAGGGGGGGYGYNGRTVMQKMITVKKGEEVDIIIGKGGAGGLGGIQTKDESRVATDGENGEATIIGRYFTVAGGRGGMHGNTGPFHNNNSAAGKGGAGGSPGGSSGSSGTYVAGTSSITKPGGSGGSGGNPPNPSADGSGGSGGFGGKGGSSSSSLYLYTYGNAGSSGGAGRNGYVEIYGGAYIP